MIFNFHPLKRPLRNTRHSKGNSHFRAALPSEPGPVPAQLSKVVAVILTRPHRSDRQQQLRPPQPQHDPTPRLSTTLGAQHTQEKPPREQPPDAERRHQRRLPLPQQDSALQQRQPRPAELGAHHYQKHQFQPQLWRSPQPQHDTTPQIRQRPPPEPGVRQAPEHQVVFRIGYAYLVETKDGRSKPLRRPPEAG
jgi:hypothetical protein